MINFDDRLNKEEKDDGGVVEKDRLALLVIVGETAGGKSALAMKVAERFNGEIIAADSRTIYKGMDVGTAKPSRADRAKISHHLIDIVEPGESFTAADFKRLANKAIKDIQAKGKLPIMVGGTGLYIDSVIFDFQFSQPADQHLRELLRKMSVEQLQAELQKWGIPLPENSRNPRHLIRQLETGGINGGKKELKPRTVVVGLKIPREKLRQNIEKRVEAMIQAGLIEEVKTLSAKYGWDNEPMKGIGYRELKDYFAATKNLEEVKAEIIANTLNLAKRQRTWFKRNSSIQWFDAPGDAYKYLCSILNN
jgi:tRNA dimethylallyltransferase